MNSVLVIAEAGVNHNGDMQIAKQLVDVAAKSGADYVKFQSFRANKLVTKSAKKAAYQSENTDDGDDLQYSMLKRLELSNKQHQALIAHCKLKSIKFLSTAFDDEGLDYLNEINVDVIKIPSGELTNYPYLKKVSIIGKPVILSSGMSTMQEIKEALSILCSGILTENDITVLHCNTEYPTPMADVNLRAMNTIGEELGVKIGYSDHTLGIEVPIAAVALGATVIEKHFTLDRNLPGPDHKASLEPQELKAMVAAIRNIELALSGNGKKEVSLSELKNKEIARKSIHLNQSLKRGTILTNENLVPLRPGNGISPMEWQNVIGKKLTKDAEQFYMLQQSDFE